MRPEPLDERRARGAVGAGRRGACGSRRDRRRVGAALVALVLGLTIAAVPIAPGAQRPGLPDLLWLPLLALLGTLALCGAAGYFGIRAGLRLSRRGDASRSPP